jgi:predicted alpha/beta superfamily hydrolase
VRYLPLLALVLLMTETLETSPASGQTSANPTVTGVLRLHKFASKIFANERMLRVWLPPGYDDPQNADRRYPVLYLNDGQNLFEPSTAFAGVEWQVDETANRLIRENAIAPMIIVGIDNAQKNRVREYLPFTDDSYQPPVKRVYGKRYPDFLINEVMPYVQRRYRVLRGSENTSLGGSSYGALISLYTVIARPGVFSRLIIESPSLYVHDQQILKESRNQKIWPEKIYLGIGTKETGQEDWNQQALHDVLELASILHNAGLDEHRLKLRVEDGATHSEAAWAARLPDALTFLFGR